jgi:hypothetical protein
MYNLYNNIDKINKQYNMFGKTMHVDEINMYIILLFVIILVIYIIYNNITYDPNSDFIKNLK